MHFVDLTGRKFSFLTVVGQSPDRARDGRIRWDCVCDCGRRVTHATSNLNSSTATSCGCLTKQKQIAARTTHGWTGTSTYEIWCGIIRRCTNPKCTAYDRYGGRGISVCDRWLSFEAFLADMGERPAGRSIDRINNDGNYEPGNCRWATTAQQQANKSNNRMLTHNGVTATIAEWSKRVGIPQAALRTRLSLGWPVPRALTPSVPRRGSANLTPKGRYWARVSVNGKRVSLRTWPTEEAARQAVDRYLQALDPSMSTEHCVPRMSMSSSGTSKTDASAGPG